jgi:hypothetical protein
VAGGVRDISAWRNIAMGILFQFLSEDDVKNLTVEQLAKLRALFYHTLHTNEVIKEEFRRKISQALADIRAEER